MMIVSNSTALVHLAAMRKLSVLRDLFGEVAIPDAVYEEVVLKGAGKPGAAEVQAADWVKRRTITNILALSVLQTTLGRGEAACIVLAAEAKADLVILDDRMARLHAQTQGLTVTGTVGILLRADEQGILNFQQALDDLLTTGFRLHPVEYQRAISLWKAKTGLK